MARRAAATCGWFAGTGFWTGLAECDQISERNKLEEKGSSRKREAYSNLFFRLVVQTSYSGLLLKLISQTQTEVSSGIHLAHGGERRQRARCWGNLEIGEEGSVFRLQECRLISVDDYRSSISEHIGLHSLHRGTLHSTPFRFVCSQWADSERVECDSKALCPMSCWCLTSASDAPRMVARVRLICMRHDELEKQKKKTMNTPVIGQIPSVLLKLF